MHENQTSKFQIRLPLILALTLAIGMFIGQKLPHYDKQTSFFKGALPGGSSAFDEVLEYIDAKYVDSISVAGLKEKAINDLLSQLDPHSVYISPEELSAVEDDMNGNFEGIGIEYIIIKDTVQVVTPLSGGPSEAAGILAGDKIVSIGDSSAVTSSQNNSDIIKRLRGPKGTQVKVGILRGKEKNLRYFTITRDIIPVKSVDIAYMLEERTGYVKINRFSSQTYKEFMEAVRPLVENQNMQNLVLDLRGNPGGYLTEATDLLSQFFPEDKLLVFTEGRTEEKREYKSNGRARFNINTIAVLIDEGSASASEIVAGAIQDHDRGWIIGRRSYGKGLVQEQYPLRDGGALRLTVSRYFTPSGRCIQRDYKHTNNYAHEADRRLKNGELSDSSRVNLTDSTKFYTGMGRIVYGGGGIIPDVYIPLDTSFFNDYFLKARNLLPEFVSRWMEGRDHAAFPSSAPAFDSQFSVSDALFEEFVQYTAQEGVAKNPAQLQQCKNELRHQLKARIAKTLFQDAGLYYVLNNDDPAIDKARQLLRNNAPLVKK